MKVEIVEDTRLNKTCKWTKVPVVVKMTMGDWFVFAKTNQFSKWVHGARHQYKSRIYSFSDIIEVANHTPSFEVWVFEHEIDALQYCNRLKYDNRDNVKQIGTIPTVKPLITKSQLVMDMRSYGDCADKTTCAVVKVTSGSVYQFAYVSKYTHMSRILVGPIQAGRDFKKLTSCLGENYIVDLEIYLFDTPGLAKEYLKNLVINNHNDSNCLNVQYKGAAMSRPAWYTMFIGEHYYHGCTGNLFRRIACHETELRRGIHHSDIVQDIYESSNIPVSFTYQFTDTKEEALRLEAIAVNADIDDVLCMNIYTDVKRGNTK